MATGGNPSPAEPHLVRQIGLWSGVAVVVGSTIGSGIFRSPASIAEKLPGPLPMLLVWVVGGLFVLCGALTLAEVGGAYPYSGGIYVFVREAYGRLPGFLFGWAQLVLIRPSAIGAVALVFGEYAFRLSGRAADDPNYAAFSSGLAVAAIVVVTAANALGVRLATSIQNLTTLAKTAGLLALIVLALAIGLPRSGGRFFTTEMPPGAFSPSFFGLALVSVLWAYDGWADCSFVGGEMANPRRNLPRAILIGTLVIIGVYLLANVAYLSVFSVSEIAGKEIIAADTMSALVGGFGLTFIVGTVMISTFGTLNGTMLTSPRIFFALAEDRLFFAPLAAVHARFRTPFVSVLLSGGLGVSFVIVAAAFRGSEAFTALTDAFVIGIVPFYALAVGSVFVFRARERRRAARPVEAAELPDSLVDPLDANHPATRVHAYDPPMRTPLFPVTPILFIGSTLLLLGNSLWDDGSRIPTVMALGVVALGVPIYRFTFGRGA
ncbi:MAG: amino acid permease [Fimbriimonadaceae bacterium]|nr:amino acid permease [Fimbriimonadaceae bacterium]